MNVDEHVRSVLIGEAVDRAGYVVLVADDQMRFLTASDGACSLLGYDLEELAKMHVPDVVQEEEAPDMFEEMIRDGEQRGRVTLRCKDGRQIPAEYEARQTEVGSLVYYVSLLKPL